ncbi:hypothetical protein AVEN_74062-1 [Araneus ventricosus]|uniref:Uncharacterized protein n=1 Tax=Araneus ventricosus TaxID=182803 RepID=A0A4Y2KQG3_ARAVE|nr:hypothetical protein AVEN_74062-1 [Araneus ventricosus]
MFVVFDVDLHKNRTQNNTNTYQNVGRINLPQHQDSRATLPEACHLVVVKGISTCCGSFMRSSCSQRSCNVRSDRIRKRNVCWRTFSWRLIKAGHSPHRLTGYFGTREGKAIKIYGNQPNGLWRLEFRLD